MNSSVIIIAAYPYPGGTAASLRLYNLAEGMISLGRKVHILSLYHTPTRRLPSDRYSNQSVREYYVFNTPTPSRLVTDFFYKSKVAASWTKTVNQIMNSETVDLVYIYDGTSFAYFNRVTRRVRRQGIPITFDITELRENLYSVRSLTANREITLKGKLSNLLLYPDYLLGKKIILQRASFFVSISTALETYLKKYGKSIMIIPGFDSFSSIPKPSAGQGKIKLLYVGALIERDAPEILQEVLTELQSNEFQVEVNFAGKYNRNPASKAIMDGWIRSFGDLIVSLGEISEEKMEKLIAETDIFILPRQNTYEEQCAFPTRLVEYLAKGKPVLVTPVGDIGLYLKDGQDVCYISLDEKKKMTRQAKEYIHRLLTDGVFRIQIGQNGFQKGKAYFDREHNAQRLLKMADL